MKKTENMIRISTFIGYNKKYEIVKFHNNVDGKLVYGAINHEYLTNGKLNRTLNGLQMKIHNTLSDLIETLQFSTELDEIRDKNKCDLMTAFNIYEEKHANDIEA